MVRPPSVTTMPVMMTSPSPRLLRCPDGEKNNRMGRAITSDQFTCSDVFICVNLI